MYGKDLEKKVYKKNCGVAQKLHKVKKIYNKKSDDIKWIYGVYGIKTRMKIKSYLIRRPYGNHEGKFRKSKSTSDWANIWNRVFVNDVILITGSEAKLQENLKIFNGHGKNTKKDIDDRKVGYTNKYWNE